MNTELEQDLRAENAKQRQAELQQLLDESLTIIKERRARERLEDANEIAQRGADAIAERCSDLARPRVHAERFLALHRMALDALPE